MSARTNGAEEPATACHQGMFKEQGDKRLSPKHRNHKTLQVASKRYRALLFSFFKKPENTTETSFHTKQGPHQLPDAVQKVTTEGKPKYFVLSAIPNRARQAEMLGNAEGVGNSLHVAKQT